MYGSLQRGFRHHDQMDGARFVSAARLSSHHLVLYEDAYPALVASPQGAVDEVVGELYRVDPHQLAKLDRFEDCPELYQRRRVCLADGEVAWAYIIDARVGCRYARIDGDYRDFV